jgi:hypothetical protein
VTTRKPAPVVIPALRPCPDCGLGMQRGRGPHGLAFHECLARTGLRDALRDPAALTVDVVEQLLLARVLEDVASGAVKASDALERVASLRRAKAPRGRPKADDAPVATGAGSRELLAALAGDDP